MSYRTSFNIKTADGNEVSLGQADNGFIIGVQVTGQPFPSLARMDVKEMEQLREILDIILANKTVEAPSKTEAATKTKKK